MIVLANFSICIINRDEISRIYPIDKMILFLVKITIVNRLGLNSSIQIKPVYLVHVFGYSSLNRTCSEMNWSSQALIKKDYPSIFWTDFNQPSENPDLQK